MDQVVENEKLHGNVIATKKKKKHRYDSESGNGDWLLESISTVFTERAHESETYSKPKKKKRKRYHDAETETAIQVENIPTISTEFIKMENEEICNLLEIAIQDEVSFVLSSENLPEPDPEMSHKRKKKMKHQHEKEDEAGSKSISFENGLLETTTEVQKKKRHKHADGAFNTLQAIKENENGRILSSIDSTMVKLCKQPLENAPSALNEHSSIEVLVNVPSATDSAAHHAEVASSSPIITFRDSLISVPLTSDSAMKRTANIPSNSNLSPTQNAGSNLSEVASVTIPSWHESLVDLSERASDNVSLTHTSVVHFSQEHSSDVHRSAIALFRRSSPSVSAMCSLSIHQSQEHLENDSSTENAGVASAQEGSSNNFHSARRQLFTEDIPNELSAGSNPNIQNSLPAVSENSAPAASKKSFEAVSKKPLKAVSKKSIQAVSKKSLPIKRVHCVRTCTIATKEDNSENPESSQESVKGRCSHRERSSAEGQEKRARHPDLPKQPASVYVRFMRDCRKELLEKNPKLRPAQIFVEAGNRYRELREEDKEKYVNEFLRETKEYNVAIKQFLENHPEHRNHWAANKRSRLEKHKSGNVEIISGVQLYINKRTREHLATHSDDNIRRIMASYRKEWKEVDDQEKVVYILEAKQLNAKNVASAESSKTKDSDDAHQATASNFHEIEEQLLPENSMPPPANGYQLFIKENANAELPFGETNRRWKKQLSQEERNTFNARAKSACETFKKRLAEFAKRQEVEAEFHDFPLSKSLRRTLKEEHKLLLSVRKKSKERPKKCSKTGRPPTNGRLLFFKELMATVMDLGFKLRFVELNSRWKNLSEEERDEYCARAREAYVKFMEENPEHYLDDAEEEELDNSLEKTQRRKRRLQQKKGEPKQPKKRQHLSEGVLLLEDV